MVGRVFGPPGQCSCCSVAIGSEGTLKQPGHTLQGRRIL